MTKFPKIYPERSQRAKIIFFAILLFGFFGLVKNSLAADYYVSPSGSALWSECTSSSTPCSPATAMNNAVAGDFVYFRGGNYYPPDVTDASFPSWYPRASGTNGNPITLIAYPGETPVIYQPTGSNSAAGIGAARQNYIIWDGFRLIKTRQTNAGGLWRCYLGNNNTIRNSEFVGNEALDSQNQVGVYINQCSYAYIYNNIFRNFTAVSGVNTGAMWLFENDHAYVYNNDFYDSSNGVQTKSSFSYIYAYNNFFRGVGRPFHWQQQNTTVTDFHIYNNVAVLPSGGTFLYAFDPAYLYHNNTAYNNTVYCSSSCYGLYLGNNNTLNFNAWNNIFYGVSGATTFIEFPSGAGVPEYSNYNNYYTAGTANWRYDHANIYTTIANWRTATGFDNKSITANPLFVNVGGITAVDYKLQVGSPARMSGRGGIYSSVMGAYITGDEIIGYTPPVSTDTTPPAAPTGLSVS